MRCGNNASAAIRALLAERLPSMGCHNQVIGVLPAAFEWPVGPVQLWAPLVLRSGTEAPSRTGHFLAAYARLKPGVTYEQARSEMDLMGRRLEEQYPTLSRGHGSHVAILRDELVKPVRRGLLVLATAVGFVLLIACTNVANLLIARTATRRRELAIRAAVGAARARLLRQALTESVVLSVILAGCSA